ncbi:hypothetical protein F5146DRAFT_1136972 [Armillaria mellea]|nr:hypothetical protein F5146DRAFT_1136972 [Armillaria mellea]
MKKNNRAKGKLEVHKHKYKYDTAFTIQQISDDEDTFDANGTLTPQTYTSCAPTSRLEIVSKLFDAVDAVCNPKGSSQYII